jgi:glyceraldehyde-3-phosphate dehydrogenase (NAD(P))
MLFQKPYSEAFAHTENLFHMSEKKKSLQEFFAKK